MKTIDHARIAKEVEALSELTVSQLQVKWLEVWGEPTRSRNKDFLRKRCAWRIQANAYGGISQRARERAAELADETLLKIRNPRPFVPPSSGGQTVVRSMHGPGDSRLPAPGALIVRNYNGRKLVVTVLPKGFEFEGKHYRSLSAIAKAVTGTHWNGKLFFGLKGNGTK